jgi:ABC-type nitrate/sulfonate/bicarbonate transport system substrate-binding protein
LVDNPKKYVLNPFPTAGAVFSVEFLRNNPTAAKKISDATDKAIDFIRQNPEEAKIIVTRYIPLDTNISIKSNLYEYEKLADINKSNVQKLADILFENKAIEGDVDVSPLFVSHLGG